MIFLLFRSPVLSSATPCFAFCALKHSTVPAHLSSFVSLSFGLHCSSARGAYPLAASGPVFRILPVRASPLIRSLGSHSAFEVSTSETLPLSTEILSVCVTPLRWRLPKGQEFPFLAPGIIDTIVETLSVIGLECKASFLDGRRQCVIKNGGGTVPESRGERSSGARGKISMPCGFLHKVTESSFPTGLGPDPPGTTATN